jgi:hypothetical protein
VCQLLNGNLLFKDNRLKDVVVFLLLIMQIKMIRNTARKFNYFRPQLVPFNFQISALQGLLFTNGNFSQRTNSPRSAKMA